MRGARNVRLSSFSDSSRPSPENSIAGVMLGFLTPTEAADGTPLCVEELTGAAGDVWLMDLCCLHSVATNAGDAPRLMLGTGLHHFGKRSA